jgi:capsular exopolysaccharide synthesis family protein
MEHRNGSTATATGTEYDLQEQLHDFWRIVHRHLGLVLLSLITASALGCLYYLRAPRTYESTTEILISTKRLPGFNEEDEERPIYENTIETHALLIRSPLIIGQAVRDYDLDSLKTLADEESQINAIIENLTVMIREENTTILGVSYTGSDPEDCQRVVLAIAGSYEKFLSDRTKTVGTETLTLIENATEMLKGDLHDESEQFKEFQKRAPLLWKEGVGVNMHHERQAAIEEARSQLMVQKEQLFAQIESIERAAVQGGRSFEAAYYKAIHELNPNEEDADWRSFRIAEYEDYAERHVVRSYLDSLTTYYINLLIREARMREEFGDAHQELTTVVRNKDLVNELLQQAIAKEQSPLNKNIEDIKDPELRKQEYVDIYVETMRAELESLDRQIERLNERYESEQSKANIIQTSLAEYEQLRGEKERTEKLYDAVVAQLDEINLLTEHGGDTMEIIANAELGVQVAPNLLRVLIASLFLGSFAGCGLAWFVDRAENTFRSLDEIRRTLGVPVVGHIPLIKRNQQVTSLAFPEIAPIMCTIHQESSHLSEAFRGVRTSLYFSTSGQDHKVIQITSPVPGDGKSTIVANLAVAIAKSGKSVLVLDADFRRPSLSKLLGLNGKSTPGLAAVVAGKVDPIDATLDTVIDNLYFMPAGKRPHNPSELLSTLEFKGLLDVVRERYDFVLVDTPPILAVTDPCAVAARVDGVLLAIRMRKGVQMAAVRASETLESIDAKVLGVIVNGVDNSNLGYGKRKYGYGYGYGFGFRGYTEEDKEEVPHSNGATNGPIELLASEVPTAK